VLHAPVVLEHKAKPPTAVLFEAVVFESNATWPIAVLFEPVDVFWFEATPKDTLQLPVVFCNPA